MPITRRQFIKRSGLAAAGGLLGPSMFMHPWVRRALAETIGDRYFVVVYLDGGNDGLNTVVPRTNGGGTLRDDYELARLLNATGGIQLTPVDLQNTLIGNDPLTGAELALHPGFTPLMPLVTEGKVAVVQACGYPDYNLSHEESRTIWQTASPKGQILDGTGWVGRHLAAEYTGGDTPAISISDNVPGELRQSTASVLAIRSVQQFGFPYDDYSFLDRPFKRDAYLALHNDASATAQATLTYIGDTGAASLLTSEQYPALDAYYLSGNPRPPGILANYTVANSSFADALQECAKVIWGVHNSQLPLQSQARFFRVSTGGYDTHADQGAGNAGGQHFQLHQRLSNGLFAFIRDVEDMGIGDKVCVVVWSEFSRRIMQNENGTDHGSQGPVLVIGGAVNGGVYGVHPNIAEAAWDDEGNTVYRSAPDMDGFVSTDIRDVFGTLLKHWLNMSPALIVPGILPLDSPPLGEEDFYWTTPDLDLGFLP